MKPWGWAGLVALAATALWATACAPEPHDPNALAHQCVTIDDPSPALEGARFYAQPADLGVVLLHDQEGAYLVDTAEGLARRSELRSDVTELDDTYISGAEWAYLSRDGAPALRNRRTGRWLTEGRLRVEHAEGCVAPPELSLDAEGAVARTRFADGDLYGIADTHEHLMSNWGFGGGGLYHGAPFHRLGVAHALPDCAASHGPAGRKDFIGFAFDRGGADDIDVSSVVGGLFAGELPEDNHATAGWPTFAEWPDAVRSSTHQTLYHRWLERAWLAGLRLVVQHATSNAVLCQLTTGAAGLPTRYPCDDMTAVDRSIDEMYALERYLDALAGGPGEGWLRIVRSPAEAREVIGAGKLAVVLGIETSDLFDCRLTPVPGGPVCDEAHVVAELDAYHARGVRAVFPVHKYDNRFSAGDGDRNFIELGNFLNSGHYSNFVAEDCPDVPSVFDEGPVVFGGLNEPRESYLAPPPEDVSGFAEDPLEVVLANLGRVTAPALPGDHCQNAGLTPLGERLIVELMRRGMIVEVDHLPRRAYVRALQILDDHRYPAVGTHRNTFRGEIYKHGGLSKASIGRCRDPSRPGALLDSLRGRLAQIASVGGYPAEGLGFDLNGFAGARGGRFAPDACPSPQQGPTRYPFTSYAGDVRFTEPFVGTRRIDFDQEGFVHIGMLPELLDDARRDAASDEDLEPLFRSAEAYVRMWERAEAASGSVTR